MWANRGNGGSLIKFERFSDFFQELSWRLLKRPKTLSWGPLRFSTIGKSILRTFIFSTFFTKIDPWPISASTPLGQGLLWCQARPDGQPRPSRPNKIVQLSNGMQISSENVNFTVCFWRSAHRLPLFIGNLHKAESRFAPVAQYNTARARQINLCKENSRNNTYNIKCKPKETSKLQTTVIQEGILKCTCSVKMVPTLSSTNYSLHTRQDGRVQSRRVWPI